MTALFVISAPSGAGKTTLINRVAHRFPTMRYSVSCTTRTPRVGERDGVDYHFVDRATFERMIDEDRFLEYKEVHGNLYGTPAEPVYRNLERGISVLLDIDVEGAREVFRKMPDAVGIFISPPNAATLEKRLRSRATEDEHSIRRRLDNALSEMEAASEFTYRVVNKNLDRAAEELTAIIERHMAEGSPASAG